MHDRHDLKRGWELLFGRRRAIFEDCTEDMERVRREGLRDFMPHDELVRLLERRIDNASRARDGGGSRYRPPAGEYEGPDRAGGDGYPGGPRPHRFGRRAA